MSADNPSDRETSNSCEVVSEYFLYHLVMDESSIKNKEKILNTSKSIKSQLGKAQKKPRKKRIRGQKDIRTLIKGKKNELVTYSKDFDLICKQAGIDVDPDQIQLSIALAKSLQDSNPESPENSTTEKALTSQQRKRKIRSTLQEYGFKVPENKAVLSKKVKKIRKQYKLLLTSDTEKRQVIADKYAQLLLWNENIYKINDITQFKLESLTSDLYNLSTSVSYACIKGNEIFYVDNLLEKSLTETHYMLKDWSNIPGRPVSPKLELPDINFNSIAFTEEELAIILSGTIDLTQDIVKRKYKSTKSSKIIKRNIDKSEINSQVSDTEIKYKNSNIEALKELVSEKPSSEENLSENSSDKTDYIESQNMSLPVNRACSPDIFDDEVTIIMDSSKDKITTQEEFSTKTVVREQFDFMDLTECVNIVNYNTVDIKQNSYLSQGSDKTKINQNDYMDLTGCVNPVSQITLNNKQTVAQDENAYYEKEVVDLTQLPNVNNTLDAQHNNSDNKSLDESIVMVDDYCVNADCNSVKIIPKESDIIHVVDDHKKLNDKSPDITIRYDNGDEYEKLTNDIHSSVKQLDSNKRQSVNEDYFNKHGSSENIDLTQSSDSEDSSHDVHGISNNNIILDAPTEEDYTSNLVVDNDLIKCGKTNLGDELNFNYETTTKCSRDLHEKSVIIKKHCLNANRNFDFNSDLEFDNVIGNVLKTLQNTTQGSNSERNPNLYGNHIRSVNSLNENHQLDQMQNSDCSEIKNCSVKALNMQGGFRNVDENVIRDSNKLIQLDKKFTEIEENNSENINGNSNNVHDVTGTNIMENSTVNREKNESFIDYENDHEFDHVLKSVFKSNKNIVFASKSFEDGDASFSFKCDDEFQRSCNIQQSREFFRPHYSDCSEYKASSPEMGISGELGKRNNISIDYDEVYMAESNETDCDKIDDKYKDKRLCEGVKPGSGEISEVFDILDDEYNCSIDRHKQENRLIQLDRYSRFDIGGISIIDGILNRNSVSQSKLRCSCSNLEPNSNENDGNSCLPECTLKPNDIVLGDVKEESKLITEVQSSKISTPSKYRHSENILRAQTPKHNDYVIKTDQVTPMPNYENMTSPEREEELDKYGIKPLKRKRAIQILTHIYNQTHPVMKVISKSEECPSPMKVRRKNEFRTFPTRTIASQIEATIEKNSRQLSKQNVNKFDLLSQKSSTSCEELSKSEKLPAQTFECINNANKENNLYNEITQVPDIRDIACCPEDWIFQKREKAKVHSCRVPLHIAFHNFVSCRRPLREAILKYEPIDIDAIHKGLVSIGYRYNPKDLLKFMDKKCITVKTEDKTRNNKK